MKRYDVYSAIRRHVSVSAEASDQAPRPSSTAGVKRLVGRHKMAAMNSQMFMCLAADVADEALRRSNSVLEDASVSVEGGAAVVEGGDADSSPIKEGPRANQRTRLSKLPAALFLNVCVDTLAELETRLPKRIIDEYNVKNKVANSPDAFETSSQTSDDVDRMSTISEISALSQYLSGTEPKPSANTITATSNPALQTTEITTAETESSAPSNDIEKLKVDYETQIRDVTSRLADLESVNASLEVKLQTAVEQSKHWESSYTELEEMWSVETMPSEIEKLKEEIKTLSSKLEESLKEIESSKETAKQLEKSVQETGADSFAENAQKVNALELEIKQLQESKANEISALKTELDETRKKNEDLQLQLTQQADFYATAGANRKERMQSLSSSQNELTSPSSSRRNTKDRVSSAHPTHAERSTTHSSVSSLTLKQLQESSRFGASMDDNASYDEIKGPVTAFHELLDNLTRIVRSVPRAEPPAILLPLKQVLLTCRQVSETASLPLSFEDAATIDRKEQMLDNSKQNLSESLVGLMDVVKRFAIGGLSNGQIGVTEVEREIFRVRGVMNQVVDCVRGVAEYPPMPTTPPTPFNPDQKYVEETRNSINQQTTGTVQAIQSLLGVLRTMNDANMASLLQTAIVPQILTISTAIDHLISSSDSGILQRAHLFGCEPIRVEDVIVGLDSAKAALEEMGSGLVNNSSIGAVAAEDSRVVKHKVGTAAYAVVKSMKEFCDILGV
ncbi:hypothetical protein CcCBS67573_g08206 [Chytriomyces confervae]|uniref:GIT Spa2 homology (SHD) domain-containing protein n=1 Tax=Chytriomyces confervae TaxID=246404 RepID=A0A507EMS2_9FUNG|nr:hypothetical protein CcCBS67573_g08206 [Chytriomyces confervae]